VFRAKFLPESFLGITPIAGYSPRNNSFIANIWLEWLELTLGRIFLREYRIGKYFCDAFDLQTKIVYEFFGCYFHGCPICYSQENSIKKQLYEKVEEKLSCYMNLELKVVVIWECQFKSMMSTNFVLLLFHDERITYYKKLRKYGGASMRESFFGGRTNNIQFSYKVGANESIEYKDVTSEYPFVLKNFLYPIGHPMIIRKNFDLTSKAHFGFVKCRILPSNDHYLPVLPSKINKKHIHFMSNMCNRKPSIRLSTYN